MPSLPSPPELTLDQRIEMTASARDADAIPKVDGAGAVFVDENGERVQRMHNGLKVLADGYCGPWMTQLIERCRGHHEPQEELAFHSLIERLSDRATMIEIGANWSYYSLWFARGQPLRRAFIVEPDPNGLALAAKNLALNGLSADITRGYIGESYAALQASHADPAPDPVHVHAPRRDLLPLDENPARVDPLEQVHAAQQRRLAGAGRTDQAHDLVLAYREVDSPEHGRLPERLVQPLDLERGGHASTPETWRRRRSRRISQSVKRASGIVIATKSSAAVRYDV